MIDDSFVKKNFHSEKRWLYFFLLFLPSMVYYGVLVVKVKTKKDEASAISERNMIPGNNLIFHRFMTTILSFFLNFSLICCMVKDYNRHEKSKNTPLGCKTMMAQKEQTKFVLFFFSKEGNICQK